jgi:hypothetical protein
MYNRPTAVYKLQVSLLQGLQINLFVLKYLF